jgi:translation initiation factor 6 (eIF-6)
MTDEDALVTFGKLSETLEMIEDALLVAAQGLKMTPTVDERRALERATQQELSIAKMKLVAAMKAVGRGQLVLPRPTQAQIDAIKALARQVDEVSRESVAASGAIAAAGQALDAVGTMPLA